MGEDWQNGWKWQKGRPRGHGSLISGNSGTVPRTEEGVEVETENGLQVAGDDPRSRKRGPGLGPGLRESDGGPEHKRESRKVST